MSYSVFRVNRFYKKCNSPFIERSVYSKIFLEYTVVLIYNIEEKVFKNLGVWRC